MELAIIKERIYEIRNKKMMLDFELATLYQVSTRALNQAIKRNVDRFPEDFCFRLTREEWAAILTGNMMSQFVTSSQNKRKAHLTPYAFNERGVAMLASVLRSERAAQMNVFIIRAFIALKKHSFRYSELLNQLHEIREKLGNHDVQFNQIFDAIENLLDAKVEQKSWTNREPIGFKR